MLERQCHLGSSRNCLTRVSMFYNCVESEAVTIATIQVSAHINASTKERLERRVREMGTTRAHLMEQALQYHLQALDELPLDVLVPARIVLDRDSAERVRDLPSRPPEPSSRAVLPSRPPEPSSRAVLPSRPPEPSSRAVLPSRKPCCCTSERLRSPQNHQPNPDPPTKAPHPAPTPASSAEFHPTQSTDSSPLDPAVPEARKSTPVRVPPGLGGLESPVAF
jgi:hypothetical protein